MKLKIAIILLAASISLWANEHILVNLKISKNAPSINADWSLDKLKKVTYEPYDSSTIPIMGSQTFYLSFDYENLSPFDRQYIYLYHLWTKKAVLIYEINDSIHIEKGGIAFKSEDKSINSLNSILPLPISNNKVKCYLYIEGNFNSWISLAIQNSLQITNETIEEIRKTTFFNGVGLLGLFCTLFLFIYLKESVYAYYTVFILSILLNRSVDNGFIFSLFPFLNNIFDLKQTLKLYTFGNALFMISTVLYFYKYFSIKTESPKLSWVFFLLIIIRLLTTLLELFEINIGINNEYFNAFCFITMLTIAVSQLKKKRVMAILAILSLLLLITGVLSYTPLVSTFDLAGSYQWFINISSLEIFVFFCGTFLPA